MFGFPDVLDKVALVVLSKLVDKSLTLVISMARDKFLQLNIDNSEERFALLHSDIVPQLLAYLEQENYPLYQKLSKIQIGGETKVAPFLELGDERTQINAFPNAVDHSLNTKDHNEDLLNWLRSVGKNLFNGKVFTLDSFAQNNCVTVGTSDYFSTLSYCDVHYHDLIRNFPIGKMQHWLSGNAYRKVQGKWLDALNNASDRKFSHPPAIGGSVLTVIKNPKTGRYEAFYKTNSSNVASAQGEKHVIPSFMYGPVSGGSELQKELDFKLHIIKEFGEEILGIRELERYGCLADLQQALQQHPLLQQLQNNDPAVTLQQTGFILDIFRLRPEFTYVLVLHDPIEASSFSLNWETKKNSLECVDVFDDEKINQLLKSTHFCPPGLAALYKGIPAARKIIEQYNPSYNYR